MPLPQVSSRQFTSGALCISVPHVTPDNTNQQVMALFNTHKALIGLPVLDDQHPVGMINRHHFLSSMSRPFFHELYDSKSCTAFMDNDPLVIDAQTTLNDLAQRVVETGDKAVTEGFILTQDGRYTGIGLGIDLIKTVSELHARQHQQIMQSIDYARVIQEAMLARSRQAISHCLEDWCLFWQPRDVVGGDFYAFYPYAEGWLAVIADCTGHGVPGAFMTVIFSSALEKALTQAPPDAPEKLLQTINQYIKQTLGQTDTRSSDGHSASNDGCDAIALYVDTARGIARWASARTTAFILPADHTSPALLMADRCGIGYVDTPFDGEWTRNERQLLPGDKIVIMTDGVTDQPGDARNIMFGRKRIQSILDRHKTCSMAEISHVLHQELMAWQGQQNARDDITWFGFSW